MIDTLSALGLSGHYVGGEWTTTQTEEAITLRAAKV